MQLVDTVLYSDEITLLKQWLSSLFPGCNGVAGAVSQIKLLFLKLCFVPLAGR